MDKNLISNLVFYFIFGYFILLLVIFCYIYVISHVIAYRVRNFYTYFLISYSFVLFSTAIGLTVFCLCASQFLTMCSSENKKRENIHTAIANKKQLTCCAVPSHYYYSYLFITRQTYTKFSTKTNHRAASSSASAVEATTPQWKLGAIRRNLLFSFFLFCFSAAVRERERTGELSYKV